MRFLNVFAFLAVASAEYHANINYGSPSALHNLAISIPIVKKRHLDAEPTPPVNVSFTHGIASGDPYAESVILWTRASPFMENDRSNITVSGTAPLYNHDTLQYVEASKNPICVEWLISPNEDLSETADSGIAYTSSDIDYTIKVEAKKLEPFTWYYYQFNVCGSDNKSPLGRTKTAPKEDDEVEKVGVAIFSCANFARGFFNAYGNSARKDNVDYVVHLGDYFYEYNQTHPLRPVQPLRELFTLYDYRTRLATYRTDRDLLLSHSKFPWIPTWDDHETANNAYRDGSSRLNNTEQSFERNGQVSFDQRKMNAVRAYFEWQPIRQVDMDNNLRIWRSFKIGKLFDLIILDTRNYDRSITDLGWNEGYIEEIYNDASRTMMGSQQENWFYRNLKESSKRGAAWRLIGSQTVFSTINTTASDDIPLSLDSWDGYQANKNRTLKTLYDNNIGNNIVMAGDSHANWAADLVWFNGTEDDSYDPATGRGSVGVEFAGTSVASPGACVNLTMEACNELSAELVRDSPMLQWQENYYRGYYEMQISKERVVANYFGTPSLESDNSFEISLANFTVESNDNRIQRPLSGGRVENGALRSGEVLQSNLTVDLDSESWFVHQFPRVNLYWV